MIKNGFGSISERLIATIVAAPAIYGTNLNSILQLSAKNDKRIFTINAGYSKPSSSAATNLGQGRLLVVGSKFTGTNAFIDPLSSDLPNDLSSAQIYFDAIISSGVTHHFDFNSGIYIPDSVDASVILTFCTTDADYPESVEVCSFLNVTGFVAGGDKIFKNIN